MKTTKQLDIFEETVQQTPADVISEQVFSVSDAVELINGILAPLTLTIEGEISGFKISQGKFVFFDIKDENAVLNCFMMAYQMPFALEDGMKIRIQGVPKIRPNTGKFSLTVKSVELIGEGALQKAFEQLKAKLESEGLFDTIHKQPIPFFPKTIGLVTSPTGDALQDMLRIMKNRAGGLRIFLAPVAVQGQRAVSEICAAIQNFNSYHPVDVMIVARGGGSLEDLQAFNSEPVVRAVFASKIPIITGVGHEPDVTLVDFVSDVRAATPTNAAELAVPDFAEVLATLEQYKTRIGRGVLQNVAETKHQLDLFVHRLARGLEEPTVRTRELGERLAMHLHHFKQTITSQYQTLDNHLHLLERALAIRTSTASQELKNFESTLQALNPARVLSRGYSIASLPDGTLIRSSKQIRINDAFAVTLGSGKVESAAVKIDHDFEFGKE